MDQALGARYVLRERLGRGGMGTVYRASHRGGGPDRAVKMLHPNLVDDPAILARFVQERSIMLDLRSPHLVAVEDLVVDGDAVGIVMELVEGGSLRDYIVRYAPLPPGLALTIVGQILAGLVPVHSAKIVHRDLKPENVLVTGGSPDAPTVKVSDFGIARLTANPGTTRASDVIGTPHYIAPELAEHAAASPAADVYAVGVILHELLTGATPHAGDTLWGALRKAAEAAPPPPVGVPGPVAALLTTWLDPRPHYRAANAAEALNQSEPVRVLLLGPSGRVPEPTANPDAPVAGLIPPQAMGFSPSNPPVVRPGRPGRPMGAGPGDGLRPDTPPSGATPSTWWAQQPGASWPDGAPAEGGAPAAAQSGQWTRAPGSGPHGPGRDGSRNQGTRRGAAHTGGSGSGTFHSDRFTQVPSQRSHLEPGIAPHIGSPLPARHNRHQLWVLVAVAAVLLSVVGIGLFFVSGAAGSKEPTFGFAVERYPSEGLEVTRTWQLTGDQGAAVRGTLRVTLGRGGPVDLDEVLPASMVGSTPGITPTPVADTVRAGPDPVIRYHLSGTPGQTTSVSYVVAVQPGPRTVGRLQAWASARNEAAAAYWQERHQLASLTVDPPVLDIRLPGPPQQLNLSGRQSDGSDAPSVALNGATWKSSDPSVAMVDGHGIVTGVSGGSAQIIVNVGSATTTAKVTVAGSAPAPAPVASCTPVAPSTPSARVDGTTVTVSWEPVAPPRCALTGYVVTASPSGARQAVGAGSTSQSFTSLAPGSYSFTVIADFGGAGSSPASPSSSSVEVRCSNVDPPSQISAQEDAAGGGSVTVGWTVPTVPAGCDSPSSYEVDLDGGAATTASAGATSASINVQPGTHRVNVVGVMPNGTRLRGSATSVTVTPPATDSPAPSIPGGATPNVGRSG